MNAWTLPNCPECKAESKAVLHPETENGEWFCFECGAYGTASLHTETVGHYRHGQPAEDAEAETTG